MTNSAAGGTRNGFFDAVRTAAILRVVVWHAYGHAWISYLIASMPAMFFVAGALMAHSLRAGSPWPVLLRRLRRLLVPLWALGAAAIALMLLYQQLSSSPAAAFDELNVLFWILPVWDPQGSEWALTWWAPLWYLRCLMWLLLASPALLWLWRRTGPALLICPIAGVALGEGLTRLGRPLPWQLDDAALYSFFWLLGFAHHEGYLARFSRRRRLLLAAVFAAAAATWALTQDVPGGVVNASYTLHLFVGLAWLFGALAFDGQIAALALRQRVAEVIYWVNERALTIYLWQVGGLFVMYQLLWARPHSSLTRDALALPIVASVTFLAVLLFGWIEDLAAGRQPRLWPRALGTRQARTPVVRAGVAAAALVACATTFVVVSTAEVLVEPGKTIQATADTVPASGVGLQVRTRKIEASAAPAARAEASAARPAAGPTPLPGAEVAEPVQGAATVSSDELDRALASWLADWNIAGVSAALRRADGEAWTGASGSTEDGAPFLASEHYGIASISKTFTVALVLRLVERGLVDLDAPAGDYLPDFPPAQYFTVRQLIQHTSGLIVGDALPYLSLLEAAEAGLQFEPGTASLYSRAGYYLLGLIIEETLGRSYTQALHEELLEPLGLSETNMDEEVAPFEFSTHPYEAATAGLEGVIFSSGGLSRDRRPAASYFGALWSSGGVWSTTSDLARWALALWGGDHVVSDAWRPEMSKFLGPEFDYVGLGTYPACPCWLEGGRLRSARLSHLGANGMIEYDLQDGTALAVRVSATVADANVVEALDDLRNRLWSLVLGRSFAPPDALAYHKAAIPPAQDADDNEAAIPPAQDALGVEP